jgi:HD-GYP domain-containing protein (c-di-GMP phosphodiesterase class II)/PAS domain-containing protein
LMEDSASGDKKRSKKLSVKLALRTTALYVIVASLWIILSDRILVPSPLPDVNYIRWQTIKGLLFVVVTGILLYVSLRTQLNRLQQAEADRTAIETHFSNLLLKSTDAIINIDSEGRINFFNQGAETIFGYSADEMLGNNMDILLPERLIESHHQHVKQFSSSNEYSVKDSTDTVFTVILRDVTERETLDRTIRLHLGRANALAEIASRINANLDLTTVLESVCEEMAKALDVQATIVALYDRKKDLVVTAANFGIPESGDDFLNAFPAERYMKNAKEHGRVQVLTDLPDNSDILNIHFLKELGVHAIAVANMFEKDEFFGLLIALSKDQARKFTEEDTFFMKGLADQASSAIKNASLYSKAKIRLENLHSMRVIDTAIASSLDVHHILQVLMAQAISRLSVEAASIYLFNETTLMLEYHDSQGIDLATFSRTNIRLGDGIIGRVALEQRTICVEDLTKERTWIRPIVITEGLKVYCGSPMVVKGKTRGVLEVFSKDKKFDDPEWIELLETLAGQAAIAIETTSLFSELRQANYGLALTYDTTLEGWSRALDLRDKETEGHTQRVTELTIKLAEMLGIKDKELVNIRRGALLHDIGKLGVPDQILFKEAPLDEQEMKIMKQHPLHAYNLLYPIAYLRPALDIPYGHHERWDGSGYPQGLKGVDIPLAARIFAVVDVWDALISDRPYRKAWSHQKAFRYIREKAGIEFDPSVVDAFMLLMEEGSYSRLGLED